MPSCKIDSRGLHGFSGLTWTLNNYHHHPQPTNKSLCIIPILPYQAPGPLYHAEDSSTMFSVPWISGTLCLTSAPVRKKQQHKNFWSLRAKLIDRFRYVWEGFFCLFFGFFAVWLVGWLVVVFFLNDNVINAFIFTIRIIQTYRMACVGRNHLVPTPLPWSGTPWLYTHVYEIHMHVHVYVCMYDIYIWLYEWDAQINIYLNNIYVEFPWKIHWTTLYFSLPAICLCMYAVGYTYS